jgi:hypothetical protein
MQGRNISSSPNSINKSTLPLFFLYLIKKIPRVIILPRVYFLFLHDERIMTAKTPFHPLFGLGMHGCVIAFRSRALDNQGKSKCLILSFERGVTSLDE